MVKTAPADRDRIAILQERIIAFRDRRNWSQFHLPHQLAAAVSIEAAELLEIFLWEKEQTALQLRKNPRVCKLVAGELADILIFALTLTHDMGFDVVDIIQAKLERNETRFPVKKFKGVARLAPQRRGRPMAE